MWSNCKASCKSARRSASVSSEAGAANNTPISRSLPARMCPSCAEPNTQAASTFGLDVSTAAALSRLMLHIGQNFIPETLRIAQASVDNIDQNSGVYTLVMVADKVAKLDHT